MLVIVYLADQCLGPILIVHDDTFGKIIHGFPYKVPLLRWQVAMDVLFARCQPCDIALLVGIGIHAEQFAIIEHSDDVEFFICITEVLLQFLVAATVSLLQRLVELVLVVLVPEIRKTSPLAGYSQYLLRFLAFHFNHFSIFPVGYIKYPAAENLVGSHPVPGWFAAEFGDEGGGYCIDRADAAVVEYANFAEVISYLIIYFSQFLCLDR